MEWSSRSGKRLGRKRAGHLVERGLETFRKSTKGKRSRSRRKNGKSGMSNQKLSKGLEILEKLGGE